MKLHTLCILAATTALALAAPHEPKGNAFGHDKKAEKVAGNGPQGVPGVPIAVIPEPGSLLIGFALVGFCLFGSIRRSMAALPHSKKQ